MSLALLAKKEMSVGEIAEVIAVPLSNVSQHLALLKALSLVRTRKEGQTVFYSLADRRRPDARLSRASATMRRACTIHSAAAAWPVRRRI